MEPIPPTLDDVSLAMTPWFGTNDRVEMLEQRVAALSRENAELRALAYADPGTGLANRRSLEKVMRRAIAQFARHGAAVSLVVCHVEGLDALGDALGHDAAEVALRELAALMTGSIGAGDLVARIGGDALAILLPCSGASAAVGLAERVRTAAESFFESSRHALTLSLGVATVEAPAPWHAAEALFMRADAAMYTAKRHGGNCVCTDGDDAAVTQRSPWLA